jgi:two-component system response regulator ChvI
MPAPKAHLIVVDDDDLLRSVLGGNLADAGYTVTQFSGAAAALAALSGQEVAGDLLILDWKMPEMTGLDLLRALRSAGVTTPALFFTSHNDTIFEEAALSCGAVDFVDKTRSFAILTKRIELILGRADTPPGASGAFVSGPLELDDASHSVLWRGVRIDLTFGEFRVVDRLVRAGRDVTYREIYDALRGEDFAAGDGVEGYRTNVRALIKRIREKFLKEDPAFAAIANYPGFGYRWVGEGDNA